MTTAAITRTGKAAVWRDNRQARKRTTTATQNQVMSGYLGADTPDPNQAASIEP